MKEKIDKHASTRNGWRNGKFDFREDFEFSLRHCECLGITCLVNTNEMTDLAEEVDELQTWRTTGRNRLFLEPLCVSLMLWIRVC